MTAGKREQTHVATVPLVPKPLDKSVPMPLYYQLKEQLATYLSRLHDGDPIPTDAELCEMYDISRATVRQAVSELVSEGLVIRQKGRGTFVVKPKIDQDFLLVLETFNDEMQSKGLTPVTRVLDVRIRKATLTVAERLGLREDDQIVFLSRLRSVEGENPIVLVNSCLPARLFGSIIDHDLEHESMYRIMERDFGMSIHYTRRELEARLAGEYEASKLCIAVGAPVQFIETVAYDTEGTALEYSTAYYRGDRSKFSIEIRKKRM